MLLMCHNDLFMCQYRANVYFSGETGVTESVLMPGDAITDAKR